MSHETLAAPETLQAFGERATQLASSMAGFDYLVVFVQAAIVAESLVMDEVYVTTTHAETLARAWDIMADHHALILGWGLEK